MDWVLIPPPHRLQEESFPRSSSQNRRRFRAKTPKGFLYLLFSALFSISNYQNCLVIFLHFLLGIGGALERKRETSAPDHRPAPTEHPTQQCKQTLTLESFNLTPSSLVCSLEIPKGPFSRSLPQGKRLWWRWIFCLSVGEGGKGHLTLLCFEFFFLARSSLPVWERAVSEPFLFSLSSPSS